MSKKKSAIIFSVLLLGVFAASATVLSSADTKNVSKSDLEFITLINSDKAIINGKLQQGDVPLYGIYKEDKAYIPLPYILDAFNVSVSEDYKDNSFTVNKTVYIDAEFIAGKLKKTYFFEDGIIIITEKENFDEYKDLISGFRQQLSPLEAIGSRKEYEKLVEPLFEVTFDMAVAGAADSANESAPSPEYAKEGSADTTYSETNIQVEGVDEADIIKTDGEYIYYCTNEKIYIIRANPANDMEIISVIDQMGNYNNYTNYKYYHDAPKEIYIHENLLIAISTRYHETIVTIYDITDKKSPELVKEVQADGSYNTSRKIGNSLYFITSSYVHELYDHDLKAPMDIKYYDSAISDTSIKLGYNNIYYCPGETINGLTTIAGIRLDDLEKEVEISSFLGGNDCIYVSESNMYLANRAFTKAGINTSSTNTDIYKFSLNDGKASFLNKGSIPGEVLNQFSMDEKDGYLRVATTSYSSGELSNNMYVLNSFMDITGKIEGIAPTERIYSARFMGDRAYIVTFRITDPLYTIDLKDPNNPKILGALKIPGYSDYLHPYDENHLIGFGKDTTAYNDMAYYLGMKISLFDVTDINDPKELFVEYIGDRGTESELLYNHKALLFSKDKNILAFPVTLYEKDKNQKDILDYGQFTYQGAYVYDIDLKNGFNLRDRITHMTNEDLKVSGYYGGSYDKYVNRIIYIGDNLYTLSNDVVKANLIEDLSETGSLKLDK